MNPDTANHGSVRPPQPSGWRESIAALVTARAELIGFELNQAIRERSRSIAAFIGAVGCLFFTWSLMVAGGIGALAAVTHWPWHFIALGVGGIHLLLALILFKAAKAPKPPSFPITRSEFQKDREWIESLQKTPKSES